TTDSAEEAFIYSQPRVGRLFFKTLLIKVFLLVDQVYLVTDQLQFQDYRGPSSIGSHSISTASQPAESKFLSLMSQNEAKKF
ncbi:MAG: hypothetical protein KAU22_05165, partial [Desulfuromonadales bacterium]|nr:hypothetical protein [Desulfuromonadales bacterium]